MNSEMINVDITIAETCLSSANDELFYNAAAYHLQQAIEKGIKFYLHNIYGVSDTDKKYMTHNIPSLLLQLGKYDKDFINNHGDIVEIADDLTEWEASSRYYSDIVSTRAELIKTVGIAKNFLAEIRQLEKQSRENEECDFER